MLRCVGRPVVVEDCSKLTSHRFFSPLQPLNGFQRALATLVTKASMQPRHGKNISAGVARCIVPFWLGHCIWKISCRFISSTIALVLGRGRKSCRCRS